MPRLRTKRGRKSRVPNKEVVQWQRVGVDNGDGSLPAFQKAIDWLRGCDIDTQLHKLREALADIYPFEPRPQQLEALRVVIFEQRDLLLVAKTSFGKSIVLQAVSILVPQSVTIIVLPLNAIGTEQMQKISCLPLAKPVHVWERTISAALLSDIRQGVYTHILISPELLATPALHEVLIDIHFRSHVALVVVDEVHLLSDWGQTFRPSYAQLFKIRALLGYKPWFACTATLDSPTFDVVCKLAGFDSRIQILRTSVDRPDVRLNRRGIKNWIGDGFRSLSFLLAEVGAAGIGSHTEQPLVRSLASLQRISKTLIFINKKDEVSACRDTIRSWLTRHGYQHQATRYAVQLYHASIADRDKDWIYTEYAKPDSKIRILVATDALAHGADIPDIRRVIQYGMPQDLSINMLVQRFGRAARREEVTGEAYFFVERRFRGQRGAQDRLQSRQVSSGRQAIGTPQSSLRNEVSAADIHTIAGIGAEMSSDPIEPTSQEVIRLPRRLITPVQQGRTTDFEARSRLPFVLWRLANEPSCLRAIVLQHYGEQRPSDISPSSCCSNCDPASSPVDGLDIRMQTSIAAYQRIREPMGTNIRSWLTAQLQVAYQHVIWSPSIEMFLTEQQLAQLCHISGPDEQSSVKTILGTSLHALRVDISALVALIGKERVRQDDLDRQSRTPQYTAQTYHRAAERSARAREAQAEVDARLDIALRRARELTTSSYESPAGADVADIEMDLPSQQSAVCLLSPPPASSPSPEGSIDQDLPIKPTDEGLRRSSRVNRGVHMRKVLGEISANRRR